MKIIDRGYWISHHFYWQSIYNVILNAARFRSLTFFSACNPAIELGGMLHDRKTDIYDLLPQQIVPITKVAKSQSQAISYINNNTLSYPIIVKPNVGLKGYKVFKIENEDELQEFFSRNDLHDREWLIQEFVDFNKEYSLLFHKSPSTNQGSISSLVEKVYPFVVGDGNSTLSALIENYKNPFLLESEVLKRLEGSLHTVPTKNEKVVLDVIGNYSRGSKFYSKMDSVDSEMEVFVSNLFENIEGLHFFRIDFKADSISHFLNGDFKILEINGMKSEPLHIYDPQSTFSANYKTIRNHWHIIESITREQLALKAVLPSLKEGIASLRSIKKMVK